jgi:hypothetical protein
MGPSSNDRSSEMRTSHVTVLRGPIDKNDPNVFNISLVTPTGEEKETIWLPAGTPEEDVMDEIEQLIKRLTSPSKGFEYIVDKICSTKKILRCRVRQGDSDCVSRLTQRAIGGTSYSFSNAFRIDSLASAPLQLVGFLGTFFRRI